MSRLFALLSLCASASAFNMPAPRRTSQMAPRLQVDAKPALSPLAAAAAFSLAMPAYAEFDIMAELNKPPINMNPFSFNLMGYVFIGMYACYLAWQVFGPVSAEEKLWADKVGAEAEVAAAGAGPFLAAAAGEEGAQRQPSGLIYREVSPGSGAAPTDSDTVRVHYTGTLCDGTKFDSSLDRGEPSEFNVGQVIRGWQEGLQLMKVGGKAVLTVPSELAYGVMPQGSIPGNSALQFEVELLEIKEKKAFLGLF